MWVVVGQNVVVESRNGEILNTCEVTGYFSAYMVVKRGDKPIIQVPYRATGKGKLILEWWEQVE